MLLGRELPCISKALQNEDLAGGNKDIPHLDGPRSPGSLWNPSQALGESEEESHYSQTGVPKQGFTRMPDRHWGQVRSGIYLRTKPKACYFPQSTRLNAGRDVGYLFKFLL